MRTGLIIIKLAIIILFSFNTSYATIQNVASWAWIHLFQDWGIFWGYSKKLVRTWTLQVNLKDGSTKKIMTSWKNTVAN